MRKKEEGGKINYLLLTTTIVLFLIGFIALASASAALSTKKFGHPFHYLKHQIIFGILPGIFLGFLLFFLPLRFLKKWALVFLLVNLFLVALVFLPKLGITSGGAKRWLNIGIGSFQPSEFLKLTFIIYISSWMASRASKQKGVEQTFFAFLIIIIVLSFLLLLQPDTSTFGVIAITGLAIFFLSETPFLHTILFSLMGAVSLFFLLKLTPYRMKRWIVFTNPEIDPLGIGYQIKQALIAVGSGGFFGLGIGFSRQKFGFLPHSISDSIFAIFAEETGFFGCLILVILFLLFFWQSVKIGIRSNDKFARLSAVGIGLWIFFQAFINIGAMIQILPLSGIPLPFISYGGSAIAAESAAVGLLLNISKNA